MKITSAAGLQIISEKSAEMAGPAAADAGLTDNPEYAVGKLPFSKILVNAVLKKASEASDQAASPERMADSEGPDEKKADFGGISAISGLFPQILTSLAAAGSGQATETKSEEVSALSHGQPPLPHSVTGLNIQGEGDQDGEEQQPQIADTAPVQTENEGLIKIQNNADSILVRKIVSDIIKNQDPQVLPIKNKAEDGHNPTQNITDVGGQATALKEAAVKAGDLKSESGEEKDGGALREKVSNKKEAVTAKADGNIEAADFSAANIQKEKIEKEAAVEKALSKFVGDLKSVKSGNSEIKIVLEPEHLGKLTISVSRTDSGISAKIKSDDREVCGIISGQIQKLIRSMEDKGINVSDVDVVLGGSGQSSGFSQSYSGEGQNWSAPAYAASIMRNVGSPDDSIAPDIWRYYADVGEEESGFVEYHI